MNKFTTYCVRLKQFKYYNKDPSMNTFENCTGDLRQRYEWEPTLKLSSRSKFCGFGLWLRVRVVVVGFSFVLWLRVAVAGCGCGLRLQVAVAGYSCWLWLPVVVSGAGLGVPGFGWGLGFGVAVGGCRLVVASGSAGR